jgi:hypothetical protein
MYLLQAYESDSMDEYRDGLVEQSDIAGESRESNPSPCPDHTVPTPPNEHDSRPPSPPDDSLLLPDAPPIPIDSSKDIDFIENINPSEDIKDISVDRPVALAIDALPPDWGSKRYISYF